MLKSATCLLCIIMPIAGFCGTASSGGGTAAICRDANHNIVRAQVLDLYEGVQRFGYDIVQDNSTSSLSQIQEAIQHLPDTGGRELLQELASRIVKKFQFLPDGVALAPTTDLGNQYGVVVPEGCQIEPIGFYESDGSLKVSRSVYQALSQTDKAAFILHEAAYKIARDTSLDSDSANARKFVASLFAKNESVSENSRLSFFQGILFANPSYQRRLQTQFVTESSRISDWNVSGNILCNSAPADIEIDEMETYINGEHRTISGKVGANQTFNFQMMDVDSQFLDLWTYEYTCTPGYVEMSSKFLADHVMASNPKGNSFVLGIVLLHPWLKLTTVPQ